MNTTDFQRIREVFHAVCGLDDAQQAAQLNERCGDDQALRAEVAALLAEDARAETGGSLPGAEIARELLADATEAPVPTEIGRYKIVRLIGSGGMGVVYEARQDRPSRTVALKVMRPGVVSASLLKRFEQESEVLGRLQHPGIAQVYDAGSIPVPGGMQPYFAMELIDGQTLDAYVATHAPTTRDALALFAKVCDAVAHAHQRDVIHRDLKPANILVDAAGQPKILDFGIARATNSDVQVTTVQTEVGQLIGTLPYMSPEQVAGKSDAIDVRSDVYALGVVLYELLGAKLPYDLPKGSLPEAVRVICDVEPTRLSAIDTRLRGDIETIVGKAIAKDRNQRYPSVAALAADIRRYLTDRPIVARPPSAMYQLRKFAHRNVAATMAALGIFVSLVGATAFSAASAIRADRARDEAERQAEIASAINAFLNNDLLASVAPAGSRSGGRGRDVLMADVLAEAARRIDDASGPGGAFENKPAVESSIRMTIGKTLIKLGDYVDAESHLRRAFELRRDAYGLGDERTLMAVINLNGSLYYQGKLDEAARDLDEAVPPAREALGPDHPHVLNAQISRVNLLVRQEEYEAARVLIDDVYARRARTLGPEHPETVKTWQVQGYVYKRLRRYEEAEEIERRMLAYNRTHLGEDDPETLRAAHNLGSTLYYQGKYADAEQAWRTVFEERKRVLGLDHRETLSSCLNLASSLVEQGRSAEAEPVYRDGLAGAGSRYGENSNHALAFAFGLANALRDQQKYDEAEPLYLDTIRQRVEQDGLIDRNTVQVYIGLFDQRMAQERLADAEKILSRPVAALREANQLARNGRSVEPLIDCRLQLEMVTEARDLAEAYLADVVQAHGADSDEAVRIRDLMAEMPAAD